MIIVHSAFWFLSTVLGWVFGWLGGVLLNSYTLRSSFAGGADAPLILTFIIIGTSVGFFMGLFQSFVLKATSLKTAAWLGVTTISGMVTGVLFLIPFNPVAPLVVPLAQWFVLRKHARHGWIWILAGWFGLALTLRLAPLLLVGLALADAEIRVSLIAATISIIPYALSTSIAMIVLLVYSES